jgi:hypothetical protein
MRQQQQQQLLQLQVQRLCHPSVSGDGSACISVQRALIHW